LFVKRSILQFFFQIPALPADLPLWHGVDLETTDRHIWRAPEENNGLDQARERIRVLQNSAAQNTVHDAAQAAITLRLEDAEKRLAAQQEENVHNITRLSEARESSAVQLVQIEHY
jgi:hypothetical protein